MQKLTNTSTASQLCNAHLPCPSCSSSDAYAEYDDGHGFCFSCDTYFPSNQQKEFILNEYTYQYLPWRGVSADTFRFFDVKTKCDTEGQPISIGYPYSGGAYKVRDLKEKNFYSVGSIRPGLFGKDKFAAGSHKFVTITEGELDACSLYQVLKAPVVSVRSASSGRSDCVSDRSWLGAFERVYLAFDSDASGRELAAQVAKLFDYTKVYLVKFSNRKDANEYLQYGEAEELRNIWWNSKPYVPETIVSSFSDFQDILGGTPEMGVPYPFRKLTEMTYGMRTGESVLITAQEGIGKTEMMHAIEYQLLKETNDAVGAIFLEEPKRRHLQALAGLELQRPVHLPDCGINSEQTLDALKRVVQEDNRLYVYTHFGSDDPDVLLDIIRFLVSGRSCRWVLLDHVTMVVSGSIGDDVRRQLDYFTTRSEMMVKELDFGLIVVSHVNDLGQTRDSRMSSKVADIRIDLARDHLHPDFNTRHTTTLTVSKNRFSGKTGFAGKLFWDYDTFSYKELPDASNEHLARSEILAVG
jgi:twinkle protein